MTLILGLTGGIATGKSTVARLFQKLGYPCVDADQIARDLVQPGQPGLAAIVRQFGTAYLLPDQSLDRKKLGAAVFSDADVRAQLNACLRPHLKAAIRQQIQEKKVDTPLLIVDIPLLFEEHYETFVDQIAVVYTSEATQISRLMHRDHLSKAYAQQKIASQWPLEVKKQRADIVFTNEGSVESLENQVKAWVEKLIHENKMRNF